MKEQIKKQKIIPITKLFWFLKEGVELDITEKSTLDMYVQQIITHGNFTDVKNLLTLISIVELKESLKRIKHFIPKEVKNFWEDCFESYK